MLYVCVQRFDVMFLEKKIGELNKALVPTQKKFALSHRMFRHMYEVLNIENNYFLCFTI